MMNQTFTIDATKPIEGNEIVCGNQFVVSNPTTENHVALFGDHSVTT